MKLYNLFLLALLLLISCSDDDSNILADPTLMRHHTFTGITYTDEFGRFLGRGYDPSDWKLISGQSPYVGLEDNKIISNKVDSIIIVLPNYNVMPAYPNPSTDYVIIEILFPVKSNYSMVILDQNYNIVFDTSGTGWPGIARIGWNCKDRYNRTLSEGIYRVVYDIGVGSDWLYTGFGDIWLARENYPIFQYY